MVDDSCAVVVVGCLVSKAFGAKRLLLWFCVSRSCLGGGCELSFARVRCKLLPFHHPCLSSEGQTVLGGKLWYGMVWWYGTTMVLRATHEGMVEVY